MKPKALILCIAALGSLAQAQETPLSLDRALSLARSNRASITAARLRVTSARQARRGLAAFPSTQLLVGYSSPVEVGGSDDDLVLVQPLDVFGRTAASRSVGNAAVLRAEAELQAELAQLQTEVIAQYSEAAAAGAFADIARKGEVIAQQLYEAIKTLVEEGRLPGVQLTRVSIEVQRARLTADQHRAEQRAALQRLAGLIYVPAAEVSVSGFAEIDAELLDPSQLKAVRADLRALAAEVAAAEAGTRVAALGSKPELEVQGRRTAWQDTDTRVGLRIQLVFPINDFGRVRAETAAARALTESARKALDDATRLAQSGLEAARIQLVSASELMGRYEQMVVTARSLVETSTVGFGERAITLVELLEATRALREVESSAVEARLRLAEAQAAYLRASGRILEVRN